MKDFGVFLTHPQSQLNTYLDELDRGWGLQHIEGRKILEELEALVRAKHSLLFGQLHTYEQIV